MQYLRAVLRWAFQQSVKWDWIRRNVVTLTEPSKMAKAESPLFTPAQAQALLAAFEVHRHEAMLTVFIGLGLRGATQAAANALDDLISGTDG